MAAAKEISFVLGEVLYLLSKNNDVFIQKRDGDINTHVPHGEEEAAIVAGNIGMLLAERKDIKEYVQDYLYVPDIIDIAKAVIAGFQDAKHTDIIDFSLHLSGMKERDTLQLVGGINA